MGQHFLSTKKTLHNTGQRQPRCSRCSSRNRHVGNKQHARWQRIHTRSSRRSSPQRRRHRNRRASRRRSRRSSRQTDDEATTEATSTVDPRTQVLPTPPAPHIRMHPKSYQGSAPAPYYHEEGPYNYIDAQAQQGPYGDGTYHPSGQPVIRNVQARRNTRIERVPTLPNVGIAQNFEGGEEESALVPMGGIGIGIDIGISTYHTAKSISGAFLSCGSRSSIAISCYEFWSAIYHGRWRITYLTVIYVLLASKSWQARRISFVYVHLKWSKMEGVALVAELYWLVERRGWTGEVGG